MNFDQLEEKLKAVAAARDEETLIYDLLSAYGLPNATITRLRNGTSNLIKDKSALLLKKKVYFRVERKQDLHAFIDDKKTDPAVTKQNPRFLIVTDLKTLLAVDTKTGDGLDIPLKDLPKYYDFFLSWAGLEKAEVQRENPADIKAAERMGRLYDLILADNPVRTKEERHALNVFLSRLLFCYFAEDTGIFKTIWSVSLVILRFNQRCLLNLS